MPPSSQSLAGQRLTGRPSTGRPEKAHQRNCPARMPGPRSPPPSPRWPGMRTASTDSKMSPVSLRTRPSRLLASSSTVRAGSYSVSRTIGMPAGGRTMMSGWAPACSRITPVSSAVMLQEPGSLRLRTVARALLNAVSTMRGTGWTGCYDFASAGAEEPASTALGCSTGGRSSGPSCP